MRKLFDFSACFGDAPQEPEVGSSQEAWDQYYDDFNSWHFGCLAKAEVVIYPPHTLPPDEFQDRKGNIWIRTISKIGVEFKLDLFDKRTKAKNFLTSRSGKLIIIGIRITPGDGYHLLSVGEDGLKVDKLKPKNVRLAKLLNAITNNTRIPNADLSKVPYSFWNKAPFRVLELQA